MTVAKLKAFPLDGLLAFQSLQDVLSAIIAQLAEHDARGDARDAEVAKVRQVLEATNVERRQVDRMLIDQHNGTIAGLQERLDGHSGQLANLEQAASALAEQGVRAEALNSHLEHAVAEAATRKAATEDVEKQLLEVREEHDGQLRRLGALEEMVRVLTDRLRKEHMGGLNRLASMEELMRAQPLQASGEVGASQGRGDTDAEVEGASEPGTRSMPPATRDLESRMAALEGGRDFDDLARRLQDLERMCRERLPGGGDNRGAPLQAWSTEDDRPSQAKEQAVARATPIATLEAFEDLLGRVAKLEGCLPAAGGAGSLANYFSSVGSTSVGGSSPAGSRAGTPNIGAGRRGSSAVAANRARAASKDGKDLQEVMGKTGSAAGVQQQHARQLALLSDHLANVDARLTSQERVVTALKRPRTPADPGAAPAGDESVADSGTAADASLGTDGADLKERVDSLESHVKNLVQDRVGNLDKQVKGSLQELQDLRIALRGAMEKALNANAKKAEEQMREELTGALGDIETLKEKVTQLDEKLCNVDERHALNASHLSDQIAEIRVQVDIFANVESCVTTRCLSCYDRRSPERSVYEDFGPDGKPHKTRPTPDRPSTGRPTTTLAEPMHVSAARLPTVADKFEKSRLPGPHKPGSKAPLMGGAGATLHQYNVSHYLRVEEQGAIRSMKRQQSAVSMRERERRQAVEDGSQVSVNGGMYDIHVSAG